MVAKHFHEMDDAELDAWSIRRGVVPGGYTEAEMRRINRRWRRLRKMAALGTAVGKCGYTP